MRTIIISLIAVACMGLYAADSKQTKEQQLNKQIAVLESKVFALESENKKLKAELEKKNKAIQSLAMRLAGQPAKSNSQNRAVNDSHGYDPAEAAKVAAEQQKQQRARQLAIIDQKIKYYEKQKSELEKNYQATAHDLKSARNTIGKSRRKEAIQEVLKNQKKIKSQISNIDHSLEILKRQRFNYL